MQFKKKLWIVVAIIVVVAAVSIGLVAKSSSGPSANAPKGTITFAEAPTATPNYIFPYVSGHYFSVANLTQFQELMYRPLYWFGLGKSISLQPQLSLAASPVYSHQNKTVTLNLKGWKFANGQTVNAQSVMFFLNMYKADPTGYGGYVPNYGIPDQVTSASGKGNTVVINFSVPVSANWMTYNYLSEITPMPNSWDRTATSASGKCATDKYGAAATKVACKAVEAYLVKLSSKTTTFTNKLWQGGDTGPWKLTKFDNLGNATFVPNTKYSGPQKAQVGTVKELAFTTAQAEQNQLQAGAIDIGYVDPSVLVSPAPAPGQAGANLSALSSKFTLRAGSPWSTNYDLINFKGSTDAAEMAQLYVRAALEQSINQPGILKNAYKNYGFLDYSALPTGTPSSMAGTVKQPYPYSLSKATALFTSHGWTTVGGNLTCTSPGTSASQCGANIAQGTKMTVSFQWTSGSAAQDAQNNAIVAAWTSMGITVSHTESTFDAVISSCPGGTTDICSWGGGWIYAPDFYPTGESLFAPGAAANYGSYVDPSGQMAKLIHATISSNVKLTAYAQYTATQLPVLFVPNQAGITETIKTLKSSIGFYYNPLQNFMPEYMHF